MLREFYSLHLIFIILFPKIIINPYNSSNSLSIQFLSCYPIIDLHEGMFREEKALPCDGQ
jgi:hypothetical protein